MTDSSYPFADQLTRHHYRLDDWRGTDEEAQRQAELEGHVPPAVKPVDVKRWNFTRDFVWQWITGKDSTGRLKELWFADGPWAGQSPRMIDAQAPVGSIIAFPNFERTEEFDEDGNLIPMDIRYRVEQRAGGLWFGRWAR